MYLRLPRFLAPQWVKSHPNLTHCQFCGQIYTYSTNYFKTQIGNKHFQNFLSSQYGNYTLTGASYFLIEIDSLST